MVGMDFFHQLLRKVTVPLSSGYRTSRAQMVGETNLVFHDFLVLQVLHSPECGETIFLQIIDSSRFFHFWISE